MHPLHITKVAVGCASVEILRARIGARAADGEVTISTRYRPKRAEELVGGSLYWIVKHRLAVRQQIIGFGESEDGRHCIIRLDARLVPVRARTKRAHQGWRYLAGGDAPEDHDGEDVELAQMPERLIGELSALGLI
jgi:hypothetical protein